MCSGSEAGWYLRLIDFVYHSTLGLRVIEKNLVVGSVPQDVREEASGRLITLSSLNSRLKGLFGPVSSVTKKKKEEEPGLRSRPSGCPRRGSSS